MTILDAAAHLARLHPTRGQPRGGWPCCEYVARVVTRAYGVDLVARYHPGGAWWRSANVWDPAAPWSSTAAYLEQAVAIGEHPIPGHWHVVQGWRRLTSDGKVPAQSGINGHTWLWYAVDADHGIALESSVAGGVRLAGELVIAPDRLGPLDEVEAMPWADRIAPYSAGVSVAVLRPVALSAGDEEESMPEREARPVARPSAIREAIEGAIGDAHQQITIALSDGSITQDEALSELARIVALVLDALIPTGPLDPYDDEAIRAGTQRAISGISAVVTDALTRDPERMRARADELEARNPDRAARIRARADRVEARRG
jgi:hypothetical protein